MIKILFKQPLHIFQSLRLRHKLEMFFLLLTVGTVLTIKTGQMFAALLAGHAQISSAGLIIILLNGQLFFIGLSVFFTLAHLLGRQSGLRVFEIHPLDRGHIFQLYFYYTFKYSASFWIFALLLSLSLTRISGAGTAMLQVTLIIFAGGLISTLLILLRIRIASQMNFYFSGLAMLGFYFLVMGYAYLNSAHFIYFQIGLLVLLSAIVYGLCVSRVGPFELLQATKPNKHHTRTVYQKHFLTQIPRLFSSVLQALFEKELRALWRNPLYRRAKIKLFIAYLFFMTALLLAPVEHKNFIIEITTVLFVWLHFSSGFDEKYMPGDTEVFIRTKPIKFYHYFLARYMAESLFLWTLNLIAFMGLLVNASLSGVDVTGSLLFLLLFGQLLLLVMLNFQTLFYDDARLAGYAFHFTVLFCVIMILNYNLVGPIIIFVLLIFYFYKTHQFFSE